MSVIADLIRAGVDPDLIERVANEISTARALGRSEVTPQRTAKQEQNARDVSQIEWENLRRETFNRDNFTCVYCGAGNDLECDHVLPRSKGGKSVSENLVAACKSCNASKKDRLLSEWEGRRGH